MESPIIMPLPPRKSPRPVPTNAGSGLIEITAPGGLIISTNVFAILPKIYSFTPGIGPAGTVVTLSGTSLFDVTAVQFGGVNAPVFTASTNQLRATVPAGAPAARSPLSRPTGTTPVRTVSPSRSRAC